MPVWVDHFAVAVCAISGVLAAAGRNMDLFGALVLALVTAVGGGTVRDLCLDVPVFWIKESDYVLTALIAAIATFVIVRFTHIPQKTLMIADAFGLALFGIAGTEKALLHHAPGGVAIMMGVITGVAGGILRDVLRREIPWVFQRGVELYATTVFFGALVFVLLQQWSAPAEWHRYVAMSVILLSRFASMRWGWRLPMFKSYDSP